MVVEYLESLESLESLEAKSIESPWSSMVSQNGSFAEGIDTGNNAEARFLWSDSSGLISIWSYDNDLKFRTWTGDFLLEVAVVSRTFPAFVLCVFFLSFVGVFQDVYVG